MLAMLKYTISYIDSVVQTLVSLVPTHIHYFKDSPIPIKQPLPSPPPRPCNCSLLSPLRFLSNVLLNV